MKNFIIAFEKHISKWAIIYVFVTYLAFVFLNLLFFRIGDWIYNFAMIAIVLFFLAIMYLSKFLKKKVTK